MNGDMNKITLSDVIELFDDKYMVVRDKGGLAVLRELLDPIVQASLKECDGLTDEELLDSCLMFVRLIDADFDICRYYLKRRLKVLDLIEQVQSIDDQEQARLVLETAVGVQQLRADLAEMANTVKKRIDPSAYYSYDEAAAAVGVSESTLRRQVKVGKLKKTTLGRRVAFSGRDLLDLQRERSGFKILGE